MVYFGYVKVGCDGLDIENIKKNKAITAVSKEEQASLLNKEEKDTV